MLEKQWFYESRINSILWLHVAVFYLYFENSNISITYTQHILITLRIHSLPMNNPFDTYYTPCSLYTNKQWTQCMNFMYKILWKYRILFVSWEYSSEKKALLSYIYKWCTLYRTQHTISFSVIWKYWIFMHWRVKAFVNCEWQNRNFISISQSLMLRVINCIPFYSKCAKKCCKYKLYAAFLKNKFNFFFFKRF